MPASPPKPAAPLDGAGASARQSTAALYSLLSVMFINTMGFGIVVPLLPFYGQSFHAQPWQIALIFSAYSLGAFFGEPFWGRLSDRIGRKPILISTLMANCLLATAPWPSRPTSTRPSLSGCSGAWRRETTPSSRATSPT